MVRYRTRSPSEHLRQGYRLQNPEQKQIGEDQEQEQWLSPDSIQVHARTHRTRCRSRRRRCSRRRLYRIHRRRRRSCGRRRRRCCRRRHRRGCRRMRRRYRRY